MTQCVQEYPVGTQIEVLFESDGRFYKGTVKDVDPEGDGLTVRRSLL